MDDLKDLLRARKCDEPAEFQIIKEFVQNKFQTEPTVSATKTEIIIGVRGAALAGALRPHLYKLTQLCDTEKRLIIRIQ